MGLTNFIWRSIVYGDAFDYFSTSRRLLLAASLRSFASFVLISWAFSARSYTNQQNSIIYISINSKQLNKLHQPSWTDLPRNRSGFQTPFHWPPGTCWVWEVCSRRIWATAASSSEGSEDFPNRWEEHSDWYHHHQRTRSFWRHCHFEDWRPGWRASEVTWPEVRDPRDDRSGLWRLPDWLEGELVLSCCGCGWLFLNRRWVSTLLGMINEVRMYSATYII